MMKNIFTKLLILTVLGLSAQTKYTYSGVGKWEDAANWSPNYPGTTLNKSDELTVTSGSELTVSMVSNYGIIYNNGTIINSSFVYNYGTINNSGTFSNLSFIYSYGTFVNDNVVKNTSYFTNEGTLTNNSKFTSNSFFENNGYFTNNGTFENNSFFNGKNKSHVNDFSLSGVFSPGKDSNPNTGKYLFNNNLTITGGASVKCDIKSNTVYDTVIVAGNAKISGNFSIAIPTGYDPEIGSSYTFLTAASVSGTFSYVSLPKLTNNKKFEVSYTNTSIVLKVVDATVTEIDDAVNVSDQLSLYPNPANSILYVNGLDAEETVSMYSTCGSATKNVKLTPMNNQIDVSDLAKGSYIIHIGNKHHYFVKE